MDQTFHKEKEWQQDLRLQENKMAKGLYANIHAKQEKVKKGLKDPDTGKKIKMRKKGDPGAPTAQDFKDSEKTAKLSKGGHINQHKRMAMGEDIL